MLGEGILGEVDGYYSRKTGTLGASININRQVYTVDFGLPKNVTYPLLNRV